SRTAPGRPRPSPGIRPDSRSAAALAPPARAGVPRDPSPDLTVMLSRILSTVLLWALVAAAMVFFRRDGVAVLLALFAAAAQYELYQLLQKLGYRPFRNLGVTLGVLMILVPYFVHEYTEGAEEGLASALIAI